MCTLNLGLDPLYLRTEDHVKKPPPPFFFFKVGSYYASGDLRLDALMTRPREFLKLTTSGKHTCNQTDEDR